MSINSIVSNLVTLLYNPYVYIPWLLATETPKDCLINDLGFIFPVKFACKIDHHIDFLFFGIQFPVLLYVLWNNSQNKATHKNPMFGRFCFRSQAHRLREHSELQFAASEKFLHLKW